MDIKDSIIKRIQKLLSLADNKGATRSEAENAMAMAQRLMTKYNISIANVGDAKEQSIRHEDIFYMKGNLNPADKEIAIILNRFYKVKILFRGNNGMIAVGSPEDIEIARYVHGYLRNVFFKCWNEFKRSSNELSGGASYNLNKADYYFGIRVGIVEKMEEAENSAKAEESQESCQNYEISLAQNKGAIASYIAKTFGTLQKGRKRPASKVNADSFFAGRAKGSTLQINNAIKG